jgi:hypothetical protein
MHYQKPLLSSGLLLVLAILVPSSHAAPIDGGNVLISTSNVLYEFTLAGAPVQSFPIPYGGGARPGTESARDISADTSTGDVHVYNGTFSPYMSTLAPAAGTWGHQTYAGWNTVNNGSFGGIAFMGAYVFVTDTWISGDTTRGVVRFDSGGSTTRFATDFGSIDLNIGLDGLLYVLGDTAQVRIYDPSTLALQNEIDLTGLSPTVNVRGVAANSSGEMFVATWGGVLYKTDSSGNSIGSIDLRAVASANSLNDVDVSASGVVAVGATLGTFVITDESFSSTSTFTVGASNVFVGLPGNPTTTPGLPISPFAVLVSAVVLGAAAAIVLLRGRDTRPRAKA